MSEIICKNAESRMQKIVDNFRTDMSKVRTGRAHPSILETLSVSYYGNLTPLKQIASVTVGDPRMLVVTPWDKSMVSAVEKAILESGLGLNPITAGQMIRVPLPPMTEERRKELVKHIKSEAENARIAIRNIRRDGNAQIKELQKNKTIGEDEQRRLEDKMQKLTDKFVAEVERFLLEKENDIMAI